MGGRPDCLAKSVPAVLSGLATGLAVLPRRGARVGCGCAMYIHHAAGGPCRGLVLVTTGLPGDWAAVVVVRHYLLSTTSSRSDPLWAAPHYKGGSVKYTRTCSRTGCLAYPTTNPPSSRGRSWGGGRNAEGLHRARGSIWLLRLCASVGVTLLLVGGAYASPGLMTVPVSSSPSVTAVTFDPPTDSVARARTGSGSTVATFHVRTGTPPVGGSLWTVSGDGSRVTLAAPIVGPGGATLGFRASPGGGGRVVISSYSWPGGTGMKPVPAYGLSPLFVSVLYASDSNAHAGSGSPVGSSPGYVDDLGKLGLGRGPGWVASDPSTGNYLILSVTGLRSGSYQCGGYGQYCNGHTTSSLGELDRIGFGNYLGLNHYAEDVLYASIPSGHPFAGTGCFGSTNYMALPADTCTGAHLDVTLTPVGVLRGAGGGVQSLSKSGGRTPDSGWSPGGEYVLYLTGVSISS